MMECTSNFENFGNFIGFMKFGTVRNKSKSGDFQRKNFDSVLNKMRLNLITNVFVFVDVCTVSTSQGLIRGKQSIRGC